MHWCDGQFEKDDSRYQVLDFRHAPIRRTEGVEVLLGGLETVPRRGRFPLKVQQKGVDQVLASKVVESANAREFKTAVLVAGDGYFREAIQAVRQLGALVVLAYPEGGDHSVAKLSRCVDGTISLPDELLRRTVYIPQVPGRSTRRYLPIAPGVRSPDF
jgi:uncharacterized LabA/DUF88 family protein